MAVQMFSEPVKWFSGIPIQNAT